jgi:hypothetical protein
MVYFSCDEEMARTVRSGRQVFTVVTSFWRGRRSTPQAASKSKRIAETMSSQETMIAMIGKSAFA